MGPKRVKLKKGKQKELIEKAKDATGCWKKLSKLTDTNKSYLRNDLRKEARTLSLPLYNRLCRIIGAKYDKFIPELLDYDWGMRKGVKLSPRTKPKNVSLIQPSVELAEVIGIMPGDGNIYGKQYAVRICGNAKDDRLYLQKHVKKLFRKVFGVTPKEYHHKPQNEIILYIYSKFVAKNLIHYGLIAGHKKKNDAKIPRWVIRNKEYNRACVRGLFDTDGTVFRQRGNLKIELASGIPGLQKTFEDAMKRLGFDKKWSKSNSRKVRRYGLYSKRDAERFINDVGFNNIKHQRKCPGSNQ